MKNKNDILVINYMKLDPKDKDGDVYLQILPGFGTGEYLNQDDLKQLITFLQNQILDKIILSESGNNFTVNKVSRFCNSVKSTVSCINFARIFKYKKSK